MAKPDEPAVDDSVCARHGARGSRATPLLSTLSKCSALGREGAFFDEIVSSAGLTSRQVRDALRELSGAGLVTNDTIDSLRAVIRWRPMISPRDRNQPDPTRWLPADFEPSANRYVVQRRPHLRRLPKWKRPDRAGGDESTTWPGRWSLVRVPRLLGPEADESAWAETIANQWLARYGIVSREIWRRGVGGGALSRAQASQFRDVRRGYFVRGLSRTVRAGSRDAPHRVHHGCALRGDDCRRRTSRCRCPAMRRVRLFVRSRGALVTIDGVVVLIASGAGSGSWCDWAPERMLLARRRRVSHPRGPLAMLV